MMSPTNINFSRLLDTISIGFVMLDQHHKIKFANTAGRKMLTFTGTCIGKDLFEEIPRELTEVFKNEIHKTYRYQNEVHFVAHYEHPTPTWIQVELCPNKEGISIITRDATSQYQVESKIHENHRRLILLTEAANHIIFNEKPKQILDSLFKDLSEYLNLDVYFNYIYDPAEDKLHLMNYSGIDAEKAKQIEWLAFGEAVCGCVARDRKRLVAEHVQESEDLLLNVIRGFGVKSYACHPLISYGRFIGTLSFGSLQRSKFSLEELDLMEKICNQFAMALERSLLIAELKNKNTELSDNNKQLMESEKKFRDILNGAMDGILLLNASNNIIDANPSACNKLGVKQKEIISKKICDVVEIKKLRGEEREATVRFSNKTEKTFEYSITEEVIPGHQLIIFRDITTKKKVAEALIHAKEQAEKASKVKSEFLSRMSHELRTPLNSILGFSQVLLDDDSSPVTEIQRERICKIFKSGRHLIHLINDILDHSQIESGKVSIHPKDVYLKAVINESIHMFLTSDANDISIENRVDLEDHICIKGDALRIKQIMTNLLSNAVKYNKPFGSVTVRSEITNTHVKIVVEDTGIGIPKGLHKQIFEPFYRIHHPEHNIEGTGIGLTLVKSLVTMMGGAVGLTSKENEGSSFWFSLPLHSKKKESAYG